MSNEQEFSHNDAFSFLNLKGELKGKLLAAHTVVQKPLPFIARIAIALYE